MDDYKVYETVEAKNLEIVYYTLELLRNAEKSGLVVSLKDGSVYLAELLDGISGEERCLSLNEGRDAVHMANLHKVKGLEAPVIILAAALPGGNNTNEKRIEHGDDGSEGYLFSLPRKDSFGSHFETKEFDDEQDKEKASANAERDRLIYVGATRARNVLLICDSIGTSFGKEAHKSMWKPLMEGGLPDFFGSVTENEEAAYVEKEADNAASLYKEAESSCVLNDREMETATYSLKNPSRLHISSKMAEEQDVNVVEEPGTAFGTEKSDKDIALPGNRKLPALLGTMIHKLMEMLVSTRNKVDAASAVNEIIREYRSPSFEIYEKDLEKALLKVAEHMRGGGYAQTNGLTQDLLGTLLGADEVYCEVPFSYSEGGKDGKILWNGIMDVVYCKDGKWHIVDYKTNADGNDLDKRYQAQLAAYAGAFKATTGEDADALTYHIDI